MISLFVTKNPAGDYYHPNNNQYYIKQGIALIKRGPYNAQGFVNTPHLVNEPLPIPTVIPTTNISFCVGRIPPAI